MSSSENLELFFEQAVQRWRTRLVKRFMRKKGIGLEEAEESILEEEGLENGLRFFQAFYIDPLAKKRVSLVVIKQLKAQGIGSIFIMDNSKNV